MKISCPQWDSNPQHDGIYLYVNYIKTTSILFFIVFCLFLASFWLYHIYHINIFLPFTNSDNLSLTYQYQMQPGVYPILSAVQLNLNFVFILQTTNIQYLIMNFYSRPNNPNQCRWTILWVNTYFHTCLRYIRSRIYRWIHWRHQYTPRYFDTGYLHIRWYLKS